MIDKIKFFKKKKVIIGLIVLLVLAGCAVAISTYNFTEMPKYHDKVATQKKELKKPEAKKEQAKKEEAKTETEKKEEQAKSETKTEEKKSESAQKSTPANKPTVNKPSTGSSNSSASTPQTQTQKPKQRVWIVDKPAWTETIQTPNYKAVLMVKVKTWTMGVQIMTYEEFTACNAMDPVPAKCDGSWSQFTENVQDGYLTQTVNHPEEGHWEWR